MWSAAAEEIAAEADGDHAEGDGGEWAAEETHGGSGEVEEVAEGEVVELGVGWRAGWRCRCRGGAWGAVMAKYPQTAAMSGGERDEEAEGPAEGAAAGGWMSLSWASARARRPPAMRASAGSAGRE